MSSLKMVLVATTWTESTAVNNLSYRGTWNPQGESLSGLTVVVLPGTIEV